MIQHHTTQRQTTQYRAAQRVGRAFRILSALAVLFLVSTTAAIAQYSVIGNTSAWVDGFQRSETTVQEGMIPINQFKLVRLVDSTLSPEQFRGVVFLLPSLGVEYSSYEGTAPGRHLRASIAGFFAKRKMVVYGFSSRAEGIPAGSCEAGIVDCSAMADWGLQTLVEDIAYSRSLIASEDPGLSVFIGGLSMGGIAALAAINDAPNDYDGAFIWEGMLSTSDPQIQALNTGYCNALNAQMGAGLVYDGFGNNMLKLVARNAQIRPEGLTSIPLLPGFLSNRQALVSSLATPAPGPFSMPVPGYVLAQGDGMTGVFAHASDARLFENISRFNDYVPLAVVRDLSCSLAGIETSFTANLAAYQGPLLGIGGALAFGPYLHENLNATSSTDITLQIEPDFGHIDHLMSPYRRALVERPILRWILDRLP